MTINNGSSEGAQKKQFLVTILAQEHHSLQGMMHWIDADQKLYFRSEMEMIHLLHEATVFGQAELQDLRHWITKENQTAM